MKKEIIEKIQKLLALANSNNENEAKLAASKAQELLVKYNLSSVEVEAHDAEYVREDLSVVRRVSKKESFINLILNQYFFVKVVLQRRPYQGTVFMYLGKAHNVEIALFVRSFLMKAFDESFVDYRKTSGANTKAKRSYHYGLYMGLCEQLRSTRKKVETETGLVVVRDQGLETFIEKSMGRLGSTSVNYGNINSQHAQAGQEAGRSLRIARGLESSTGQQSGRYLNK